jgi:hypothetical protein
MKEQFTTISSPSANAVAFNLGAVGTVSSVTSTSLDVTFSTLPLSKGKLTVVVTSFGISSGAPEQVAQLGEQESDGAGGLEAPDRVAVAAGGIPLGGLVDESLALVVAQVVQGKIADGAVKPGFRVRHLVPVGMEPQEGLLHQVLRHFATPHHAVGKAQERTFLRFEDLPERRFLLGHRGERKQRRGFNPGL